MGHAATGYSTKIIQYSYTIRNTTGKVIENATFKTYAPVKYTAWQQCMKIDASQPYTTDSDESGNIVLNFAFNRIPPYASRIVTVRADLRMSGESQKIDVRKNAMKAYTLPERYVESDDPSVQRLAVQLRGKNNSETIKSIFQWVAGNIRDGGYMGNDQGALYALANKRGDCTEFMYLFIALCRANGIPARGISGYVCAGSSVLKPSGLHNWAEFYDNGRWQLADAQKKIFMSHADEYVAMKILQQSDQVNDFQRFKCFGDGLEVEMNR